MTLSKENWGKLFPSSVNINEFEEAYALTAAAGEICRISNTPIASLTGEQSQQRKAILDISLGLVLADRDKALDRFCSQWLAYRAER